MPTAKSAPNRALTLVGNYIRRAKKLFFSYGTILFLIFSVFSVASLYLMRSSILDNSNAVGYEVVQRLDASLDIEFEKQKQFVELMAHYADVFFREHKNDPDQGIAAFTDWLNNSKLELYDKYEKMRIDIYAAIDGKVVAPNFWAGDENLLVADRPWYKAAMKMPENKAAILNPYTDLVTNTVITTISARIGNSSDVIALDLYLENASQAAIFAPLVPENYCFYLVDDKGTVILYYTPFDADYDQIQDYINSFFTTHVKGRPNLEAEPESIIDFIGNKRNVFTNHNEHTGWYTVATRLYSDILLNYHMIYNLFLLMVVIFVIIEIWMVWREFHLSSQIETTNEALKVLGNSYQIILRINLKLGTFTTLKAPDLIRARLTHNNFDDFIEIFSDIVIPASWNNFYKNFSINHMRALATQSIRDFGHDYQLRLNFDRNYRWFNARILFDESLDLDEAIICFRLIDKEKLTEIKEHQLLTDALESAKKNEDSKNIFFANMSHDMRTPLNGIIGLCQIGMTHLKNNDVGHLNDIFKKMTTASHQLLHLVDDILDVARPQMESKLNLAPFNIVHDMQELIDVFQTTAKQQNKQVKLIFDIHHPVVIGDTAKLRQIINNLVSNSLKYSHSGCVVTVKIREVLHLHKPSFVVEVSDTGIGMDKKFMTKLFTPYSREQRLSSVQGTGLGMSIVKNVVNIMGGDIKVKSTLNVGTTFTLNLPFALADNAAIEQVALQEKEEGNYLSNDATATSGALPEPISLASTATAIAANATALAANVAAANATNAPAAATHPADTAASSAASVASADSNTAAAKADTETSATADTSNTSDTSSTVSTNAAASDATPVVSALSANTTLKYAKQISPQAQAFIENFSLTGLHILIVEDNQLNMEIVCDILGMKGVKVTCAWDGVQAVEIFNNNPPYTYDAILMDMRMPCMDGCEASSTIRASKKEDAKTIPIIACTANAFAEDITATQNAGMNAHVSKPLDFTVLERVISRVIASRSDFLKMLTIRTTTILGEELPPPPPAMLAAAGITSK